jgi:hypothetical protein
LLFYFAFFLITSLLEFGGWPPRLPRYTRNDRGNGCWALYWVLVSYPLFVVLTKEESRVSCSRLLRFFLSQNDKIINKTSNLMTLGGGWLTPKLQIALYSAMTGDGYGCWVWAYLLTDNRYIKRIVVF